MKITGFLHTSLMRFSRWCFADVKVEQLQKLYVGKSRDDSIALYQKKLRKAYIILGIVVLFLLPLVLLADRGNGGIIQSNEIKRQNPGGDTDFVELEAYMAGSKQDIILEVAPRSYSPEELQAQYAFAKQYIQKYYLGENDSPDHITQNLRLDTMIPNSAVGIEWQTDAMHLVEADGAIHWDQIEEVTPVEIVAILTYGEEREEFPLALTLYPPKYSEKEQLWVDWEKRQLELAKQSETDEYMKLPQEIKGQRVIYQRHRRILWKYLLLAGGLGVLIIPLMLDSRIRREIGKRQEELAMDYPEVIEQYVLLIGAGMTMKGAWMRIATEYLSKRDEGKQRYRFVYEEMLVTMREMESGMSEVKAYELFGKRVGLLSYMKFSTLLVQNLRKGSDDLLRILEYEAVDAFRERKEQAKALGEKAGTKLLMPMMLMLLIVLSMIIFAAFRSI